MRSAAAVISLASLAIVAAGTAYAGPNPHPVAVELFTSQGCSSCPPADAVQAKFAAEPGVVAITRPVTYWDRLGWKDTLARPANTALQQAYAAKRLPGAGVYTPGMVVQGRAGAVGGQEAKVRGLIGQASRLAEPGLTVAAAPDGGRRVALSGNGTGEVIVVALRRAVDVAIGNGENGGRRIRYSNVLIGERSVGSWNGGTTTVAIPAAALKIAGADRYALLVRQPGGGPILAARYL